MFDDDPFLDLMCPLCDHEVGEEEHYLLRCSHFSVDRRELIGYLIDTHEGDFTRIMAMKGLTSRDFNRLARFLGKVMDSVREHILLGDTINYDNYDIDMLFD